VIFSPLILPLLGAAKATHRHRQRAAGEKALAATDSALGALSLSLFCFVKFKFKFGKAYSSPVRINPLGASKPLEQPSSAGHTDY